MIKHAIPGVNSPLWSLDVGDGRYCPINRHIDLCFIVIQTKLYYASSMLSVQLNVNDTIVLRQEIIKLMSAAVLFPDLLIVYVV
jgi:hypothetical protein